MDAPRIIDAHLHVPSSDYIPRAFVEGALDNLIVALDARGVDRKYRQRVLDAYLASLQDRYADQLVRDLHTARVSAAVVLLPDFTYCLECPLTIEEMFAAHGKILQRHGNTLAVLAGVDPRWGQRGYDLFEKGVKELGFAGLKLYPPCGYSPSDSSVFPLYEICNAHKLPVLVHIGPTSPALSFEFASPMLIDRAARMFPNVNFILGHGGVSMCAEALSMCLFRPNLYMDISAYSGILSDEGFPGSFRELLQNAPAHKVIFGTDWPVFALSSEYGQIVAQLTAQGAPIEQLAEDRRELILWENIQRLLPFPLADGHPPP